MILSPPAPYFPSIPRLAQRLAGIGEKGGKNLCRTILYAPSGASVTLTIPLCGGAKSANRLPHEKLLISDHGNWRHVHLGAIMSNCGRLPYYPHYEKDLRDILSSPQSSFSSFTSSLEEWLLHHLFPIPPRKMLTQLEQNHAATEIARKISESFPQDASILMYLMKFGPYTTFPLLLTLSKISGNQDLL